MLRLLIVRFPRLRRNCAPPATGLRRSDARCSTCSSKDTDTSQQPKFTLCFAWHGPTPVWSRCRTLELLTEARILSRLNLKDGAHRYELSRECSDRPPAEHPADGVAVNNHHHHILCTQCGAVAEFDGCIVDSLSERLEQLTGFNITDHWMEMWGLCARCKLGTNDGQQTDTEEC